MSFIQKYTPSTIDKIIGNKHEISCINQLLTDKFNSTLCIIGPQDIGKTNSLKILLSHHKYRIKYIDITKNKKNVYDIVSNYLFNKSVDSYFSKPVKTAYLIDNMEHIEHQVELSKIIQIINNKKLKQDDIIVCVSNNIAHIETFKQFKCIEFNSINHNEKVRLINRVKLKENYKISNNVVHIMAKNCFNSFNNVLNTLKQLNIMYGDTITYDNLLRFYAKSKDKSPAKKIREETLVELFSKEITAQQCIIKFNKDKSMLPMLINDNYLTFFENSDTNYADKLKLLSQCTHYIMLGDICDKLIYNQNNWANQYIHCLLSCYFPTRPICKLEYPDNRIIEISKSKTLGKYSRYRTNIKNLYLLFDVLNGRNFYSIEDVYYIACTILYHLYDEEGDINKGIKMMQYYSLDDTYIDKLQKTDVLNKHRYKIKNKNKIKKLFKDT
jgi:hypothetical protein